ncbi:MAG: methyltransferase domain-containing protein [Proteobacteria bacterium]|nr:methyltransferase domain-containing protein [Pseudomonadota bacterium]
MTESRSGQSGRPRPGPEAESGPAERLASDWPPALLASLAAEPEGKEAAAALARDIDLLLTAADLDPDDAILDVWCGPGRRCLELARRGFRNLTGLDRSRQLVRQGRSQAREMGAPVTFHQGDARRFRLAEGAFRCVLLMGGALAILERTEDVAAVLESAKRALRSGGVLAVELPDGEWLAKNFEPRSWTWLDERHIVCRERSLAADGERLIVREVVIDSERGVIADRVRAERLYSRAAIEARLAAAGFRSIRVHEAPATGEPRPRRLFLTALAPHKVGPAFPSRPLVAEVAVLLADPRLPNLNRTDRRFSPEDLDAVARMRAALAELGGYRFAYCDNHSTLLADLRARPPAFVLNFCDTGFTNDPLEEPHLPALLELLRIPYSGAGPTALGLCLDKALVRAVAAAHAIPVPAETFVDPAGPEAVVPSAFPALIKPNAADGSLGITQEAVVESPEAAIAYLGRLRAELPGRAALIQEFLTGAEYSVGLIGNPGLGFTVLPVLEVDYSALDPALPRILSYESKADPASPYWTQIRYREARVEETTRRRLVDYATFLFERLGCRDYARFDFRADAAGEIKLLEVNPNPAWCWDGKLNLMAGFAGLAYAELLRLLLEAAQMRLFAQPAARAAAE